MKKSDGEFIKIKDLNDEKTDSKKNIKSINNNSKKNKYSSNSYNKTDNKLNDESSPEKPFYELEKKNKLSSFFNNINEYLNKLGGYEEILVKSFLHLIIQFIIIFIFTYLGFIFEINKVFIKSSIVLWGTFIVTSIIIIALFLNAINIDNKGSKLLYIHLIVYIICVVFYCFLLSSVTDNINIICGLTLYILDILSFIVVILIFKDIKYIAFMIFSSVITIITLLIFHFAWIKDGLITFKISTVGLSEIIYLIIITYFSIEKVYEYLYETIIIDLGIFTPLFIIVFLAFIILGLFHYLFDN